MSSRLNSTTAKRNDGHTIHLSPFCSWVLEFPFRKLKQDGHFRCYGLKFRWSDFLLLICLAQEVSHEASFSVRRGWLTEQLEIPAVPQVWSTRLEPATQAATWDCRIKGIETSVHHFHCHMKGRSIISHLCRMTNTLQQPCLSFTPPAAENGSLPKKFNSIRFLSWEL